jgi:hypothetical protein
VQQTTYISKTGKKEDAKKARARMKRYRNSENGLKVRARYRKRNQERIRKYMREYFQKRRADGLTTGLCGNCQKREHLPNITSCKECRDNMRRNAKKQREKSKKNGGRKMKTENTLSKKERIASDLWEAIKKRDYNATDETTPVADVAYKHLKEVLEDEEN